MTTSTSLEEQCEHLSGGLAALSHLSVVRLAQQARQAVAAKGGVAAQGARVAELEAELRTEQQAHANLKKVGRSQSLVSFSCLAIVLFNSRRQKSQCQEDV